VAFGKAIHVTDSKSHEPFTPLEGLAIAVGCHADTIILTHQSTDCNIKLQLFLMDEIPRRPHGILHPFTIFM
jgi:hypothetical protein